MPSTAGVTVSRPVSKIAFVFLTDSFVHVEAKPLWPLRHLHPRASAGRESPRVADAAASEASTATSSPPSSSASTTRLRFARPVHGQQATFNSEPVHRIPTMPASRLQEVNRTPSPRRRSQSSYPRNRRWESLHTPYEPIFYSNLSTVPIDELD